MQERSAAGKKHIQQHNKEDLAEEEELDSNDDRRKLREDVGATYLSGTDNDLELKTKNREKGHHQVQVHYDAFDEAYPWILVLLDFDNEILIVVFS